MSYLEREFADLWEHFYPQIDLYSEYRFVPGRRFRADFCHPEAKVIIEIQGGTWVRGRHSTGSGIQGDCEKFAIAASLQYLIFPLTKQMITAEYCQLIAATIQLRLSTAAHPLSS